jgi:hypothetical protein
MAQDLQHGLIDTPYGSSDSNPIVWGMKCNQGQSLHALMTAGVNYFVEIVVVAVV